jgi:glucosamine-6-phosphate deaminase
MEVRVFETSEEMSQAAAELFAERIEAKPDIVLGLATGGTPVKMYEVLVAMYERGELDFSRVVTFNLDEYIGLSPEHDQSYRYFMDTNLFDRVNIAKENTHLPDGMASDMEAMCVAYEAAIKAAGGIDLQLLGIGGNGHVAFNEPGSTGDSRTRVVDLSSETIRDNSRFFRDESEVPRKAVTMGIGSILEAREIVLIADGAHKAEAVAKAVEGEMTPVVPASFLQEHPNCIFFLDRKAASQLSPGVLESGSSPEG